MFLLLKCFTISCVKPCGSFQTVIERRDLAIVMALFTIKSSSLMPVVSWLICKVLGGKYLFSIFGNAYGMVSKIITSPLKDKETKRQRDKDKVDISFY